MVEPDVHLTIYCIYYNPTDYPEKYVLRAVYAGPNMVSPDPMPSYVGDSINEARKLVPPGFHRFNRHPNDEPQIVEIWI